MSTPDSYYWVGSPQNGSRRPLDVLLTENRPRLIIHGGVSDDSAYYDFDEWALVELDEKFYLCQTAGCSCPSPSDNWQVESGPFDTVDGARQHILSDQYDGWTLPRKQLSDFLGLFNETENTVETRAH